MYTRRQVADALGVHYSTVRRWEEAGRIAIASYEEVGDRREPRFSEEEVARLRDEIAAGVPDSVTELDGLRLELERLKAVNEMLEQERDWQRSFIEHLVTRIPAVHQPQ